MSSLSTTLTQHDEAISAALATFFVTRISMAQGVHPRYELLWHELSRVTQNGGKRLRPKMTILAYEAFGGKDVDAIILIAAAQEILHSSLLIHDDIIDHELTRRGQPNVSGAYMRDHYEEVSEPTLRRHYSDSAALLGGDLLLIATFELMEKARISTEQLRAVHAVFYRIIYEVAAGQLLDSEMAFLKDDHASAEQVARYKTASYSFIGPLLIGATLAGADESSLKQLEGFALNLGIAYQLSDDLIGVYGDESQTGKSTSGDLREGKKTYLVEQFLENADSSEMAAFESLFGNPLLTSDEAYRLKKLIAQSGAKAKTEAMIDEYTRRSHEALSQLNLSDSSRNSFEQLISASTRRKR